MCSTEENSFEQNIVEQVAEDFSRKINRDEVAELADAARLDLMPALSKNLYFMAHNKYDAWCIEKKVKTNETTLLAYFQFLSKKYKPSTLWTVHSKLKTMILHKEQIDIKKYTEIITFSCKIFDGIDVNLRVDSEYRGVKSENFAVLLQFAINFAK